MRDSPSRSSYDPNLCPENRVRYTCYSVFADENGFNNYNTNSFSNHVIYFFHYKDVRTRMALRLIHTSDWQIGKVFRFVNNATMGLLQEARLGAIARLGELAGEHAARHILVAGDVYDMEALSPRSLNQPLERMRMAAVKTARTEVSDQESAVTDLQAQRTDETLPQLEARVARLGNAIQDRRDKCSNLREKLAGLRSHVGALEGAWLDEAIGQKARELERSTGRKLLMTASITRGQIN